MTTNVGTLLPELVLEDTVENSVQDNQDVLRKEL